MSYTTAAANGIMSFGSSYASGLLAQSQADSEAIISQAMTEYRKVQQEIHNNAADRNAREQTNIVSMNQLFATADAQKQKMDIRLEALAQAGKASVIGNISGISGKTLERVQKQVTESAAVAEGMVDDSMAKQQLNFIMEKKAIESARQSGQDYSVHIAKEGYSGNPLMTGLASGLGTGFSVYSKLNNDTE